MKNLHDSRSVFISYNQKDSEVVSKIANHLKAKGIEPTGLNLQPEASANWKSEMERKINNADYCAVFLSHNTTPAEPVQSKEWSAIQNRAWNSEDFTICPVLLEEYELPPFLQSWKHVEYTDEEKTAESMVDVLMQGQKPQDTSQLKRKSYERFKKMLKFLEDNRADSPTPDK